MSAQFAATSEVTGANNDRGYIEAAN